MKIIGYMNAASAWRETMEEYAPERGVVMADMVELIRTAYSFQNFPDTGPGQPLSPTLVFMGGKFVDENQSFAIGFLVMEATGDVVQTMTTDQADLVLADLVKRLDESLGYRLASAIKRKSYASNIVVEFDFDLANYIEKLSRMSAAINSARPDEVKFDLKRLAFGTPEFAAAPDQVTMIETADFLIERRAGIAFESNRYYCSAPMRTQDHIRVLTEIEAIARGEVGN